MLRDTRADEDYFERTRENLLIFRESHDEELEIPEEQWRTPTSIGLRAGDAMKPLWSLFSVDHSRGASAEQLRGEFDRVLWAAERALRLEKKHLPPDLIEKRFAYGRFKDFYREWLWLVALALAFDVDDETFDRVVAAVELGWTDRLICRLIASRRPEHPIAESLGFPRMMSLLDRAMDAGAAGDLAEAEKLVTQYQERWYTLWKGVHGWGGHDHTDTLEYWGYWSFETLGVVTALGLDDSSLHDNEYYPRDLAPGRG